MTLKEFIRRSVVEGKDASMAFAKFKYRSGLDATTEELIGTYSSRTEFLHKFNDTLKRIHSGEQFFLVADRMDESLVVLSRELGWDLVDVSYHILKKRPEENDEDKLTDSELHDLDHLQPFDSALFEAANHALDKRIDFYGVKQFKSWINTLSIHNSMILKRCKNVVAKDFTVAEGVDNMSDNVCCKYFLMDNKELVQLAWRHNLNPPSDLISKNISFRNCLNVNG